MSMLKQVKPKWVIVYQFKLHYLMMVGAIGGSACSATGLRYSEYESAAGTGQVHMWFERPVGGWTAEK